MSRLKQNQIIDRVIHGITAISKSQCSLSEQDLNILDDVLVRLQNLKSKKGKTNDQIRSEISKVVNLLKVFFTNSL